MLADDALGMVFLGGWAVNLIKGRRSGGSARLEEEECFRRRGCRRLWVSGPAAGSCGVRGSGDLCLAGKGERASAGHWRRAGPAGFSVRDGSRPLQLGSRGKRFGARVACASD